MEMMIDFPGGARVDAHFDGLTLYTDQPPAVSGEGSAPAPFDTFLASIGTCAGIYVLRFCKQRGIPVEDVRIVQQMHYEPVTRMIGKIDLEIQTPPNFPEKYLPALIRAADQCKVKKTTRATTKV